MWNQWNRMSAAVYIKAVLLAQNAGKSLRELKEDQRGLSGVVVAVLLILVAVLAVVLLWDQLKVRIENMWKTITDKSNLG